jgi:hypothetical protein
MLELRRRKKFVLLFKFFKKIVRMNFDGNSQNFYEAFLWSKNILFKGFFLKKMLNVMRRLTFLDKNEKIYSVFKNLKLNQKLQKFPLKTSKYLKVPMMSKIPKCTPHKTSHFHIPHIFYRDYLYPSTNLIWYVIKMNIKHHLNDAISHCWKCRVMSAADTLCA